MAKGAIAKEAITNKILSCFDGSFINGKEIRVPMIENGEELQIKVTLTCAKNMVTPVGKSVPSNSMPSTTSNKIEFEQPQTNIDLTEPTEEEKQNVEKLIQALF